MNITKRLAVALLTVSLVVIISSCGGSAMSAKSGVNNLIKLIERDNFNDVSLTIYYYPYHFSQIPWSVSFLKNYVNTYAQDYKFEVESLAFLEHADIFYKLNPSVLVPVAHKSQIDAGLYYVFEKNGRKIFDVAMSGDDDSIFVNGYEVEHNDIFYHIIIPFLPEDLAKQLEEFLSNR